MFCTWILSGELQAGSPLSCWRKARRRGKTRFWRMTPSRLWLGRMARCSGCKEAEWVIGWWTRLVWSHAGHHRLSRCLQGRCRWGIHTCLLRSRSFVAWECRLWLSLCGVNQQKLLHSFWRLFRRGGSLEFRILRRIGGRIVQRSTGTPSGWSDLKWSLLLSLMSRSQGQATFHSLLLLDFLLSKGNHSKTSWTFHKIYKWLMLSS